MYKLYITVTFHFYTHVLYLQNVAEHFSSLKQIKPRKCLVKSSTARSDQNLNQISSKFEPAQSCLNLLMNNTQLNTIELTYKNLMNECNNNYVEINKYYFVS